MSFYKTSQSVLGTVKESSARVYAHVYREWWKWCHDHNHTPDAIHAHPVRDFLASHYHTRRTRKVYLSAMRSYARYTALDHTRPELMAAYQALKIMRIPLENIREEVRDRIVLHPPEVEAVLGVWGDVSNPLHLRNRAIYLTFLYTGLRRAELAGLRWSDIDFQDGILRVRHGKGDKYREVTVVADEAESTLTILHQWKLIQTHLWNGGRGVPKGVLTLTDTPLWGPKGGVSPAFSGRGIEGLVGGEGMEYIFTPMRKGGHLYGDKGISPRGLGKLNEYTRSELDMMFYLHDLRRTHGTSLIIEGAPIQDVKTQLGHEKAATTVDGYAMPADARTRRRTMKVGY